MKRITLIVTAVLFTLNVFSQAPNWQWAKSWGGTKDESIRNITTDATGNVIATGGFISGSIVFGSTILTNIVNTNASEFFLTKYDVSGNVIWAKKAFGNEMDYGNSVAVDLAGNIYVAGVFQSTTITFGSVTLTNSSTILFYDTFLVKYDPNGNALWAIHPGGNRNETINSIKTDLYGNIYMTGYFESSIFTFGSNTLINSDTAGNTPNMFIAKIDSAGTVVWVKKEVTSGYDFDYGTAITIDISGNIYITGIYWSAVFILGTDTMLTGGGGGRDLFIAKYDTSGTVIWAKSAGGNGDDYGISIATDVSGNLFLTGSFSSSPIHFGSFTLYAYATSNYDAFVAKLDGSGNVLWAKKAGGNYQDEGYSVVSDASGNVYVSGYFNSSSIIFGTDTLTNQDIFGNSPNIFLVKYDASGTVIWTKTATGNYWAYPQSMTFDPSYNNLYLGGYFESTSITFGSTTLMDADISGNTGDIFLSKLGITAGINDLVLRPSEINIYPNPFTSQTTISFSEEQKNTVIKITDVLGQEIKTINFTGKQLIIEKENMKPGIYFVQINYENKNVVNRKIIIQ